MIENIKNPILTGFNPDPSICKVGDDFYVATSTFEWFPGVQIHHSKDLVNWELIKRPLERVSQLDMKGTDESCGIWAPCLTYADNKFWLIYTNVKSSTGPHKDVENYLVTCDTIDGEWSDPIYLNGKGFDSSLFHDDDGKKYYVQMLWDHRPQYPEPATKHFAGIIVQEYDHEQEKLVGETKTISHGSKIGLVEGPHIYKRNNTYYLLVAEGGTTYEHAASVFRSKDVMGIYEEHPANPILSSYLDPTNKIQKAGHASMAKLDDDRWVLVHLCGRPITYGRGIYSFDRGDCPLGRETALQYVKWENDWPYLEDKQSPKEEVENIFKAKKEVYKGFEENFDSKNININFQTLRIPLSEDVLKVQNNKLSLYGKHSLMSKYTQAHLATRWKSLNFEATTCVEYSPEDFTQYAGMTNYYNTHNYTCIGISHDEEVGRCIKVEGVDNLVYSTYGIKPIKIDDSIKQVYFKTVVNQEYYHYEYSFDNKNYEKINYNFFSGHLSDDYIVKQIGSFFTGAFVGMFNYDLSGTNKEAKFDFFKYEEQD